MNRYAGKGRIGAIAIFGVAWRSRRDAIMSVVQ